MSYRNSRPQYGGRPPREEQPPPRAVEEDYYDEEDEDHVLLTEEQQRFVEEKTYAAMAKYPTVLKVSPFLSDLPPRRTTSSNFASISTSTKPK